MGLAPRQVAGPLGLLALGWLLSELVTSPRVATMHMVWTIPSGLTWLLIAGCAIAAWVVGYGMGYRRGVKDAITGGGIKAKHRINAE